MALYRVQSNGKAPTGLQAGDEVVTGGGTYRILGVNADGSYRSALSNQQQTIYNYRGSYGTPAARAAQQPVQDLSGVSEAKAALGRVQAAKPGAYASRWEGQLQELYDRIAERGDFSYDLGRDPVYRQAREQYQTAGRLAMQDTMGQAAALTGGYGSTYGEQVGQQAYNAYLQNLNDIVPQLQQQAYQRYQDEGTDLYNQYSLVKGREDTDYGRYRDTVSDYYSDLSDARSAYNSERSLDQSQWATMLDYWAQKANNENAAYLQALAAEQAAAKKSGGGGGGGRSSSGRTGKGYIDNTYNKGGSGGAQAQTYNQLKRGMTEWIQAGQKQKAYELFAGVAGQLSLSSAAGKKQYNELVTSLNRAGFGIPLER